jgi:hypothetical protein
MNPKNSMRIFTATFFALTLTHCSVLITYDRNDNPQTDGGDFPDIISPVTEVGVTGMCLPMFTRCGDLCVDTRTSNNHCGTCGSACRPLQACVSGVCRCPVGSVANAEGNCVSLASDPLNCGMAGRACNTDQYCAGGRCVCRMGWTQAGSRCTDLRSDASNCGRVGQVCPNMGMNPNNTCINGVCTRNNNCNGDNTAVCNNACVDRSTDERNCGGCGNACAVDQFCVAGNCRRYYVPANCRSCPCNCASGRTCCIATAIASFVCIEGNCR